MSWVRKVLLVLLMGFVLFHLIQRPKSAAAAVRTLFGAVGRAFQAIVRFSTSLAG